MEVSKIDCGAWLELCPVDEKVGPVRLRMIPVPTDFTFPTETDNKAWIDVMGQFIVGWDLTSDGVAVECTDENKAKYLKYLVRLLVKTEEGKEPEVAAAPIMRFAASIDNFLKN
jgi:hypothetical protein